uniref:Uncharacterized protein n=1 Tax=Anguilla anguilla TaxID=7936 RepID=A0A0E9V4N7_ANGAN
MENIYLKFTQNIKCTFSKQGVCVTE